MQTHGGPETDRMRHSHQDERFYKVEMLRLLLLNGGLLQSLLYSKWIVLLQYTPRRQVDMKSRH